MTDPRWRDRAACRTADTALFDLDPPTALADRVANNRAQQQRHARAVTICRGCPVTTECLTEAIAHSDDGIRGGVLLCGGQPYADRPRKPGRPPVIAPCGSRSAYRRHKRNGEPIDDDCRAAYSAYNKAKYRRMVQQKRAVA